MIETVFCVFKQVAGAGDQASMQICKTIAAHYDSPEGFRGCNAAAM